MDYIKPAYCNEAKFRAMWTEFEWENKVAVVTDITFVLSSFVSLSLPFSPHSPR
jgi:vesicle coat complex subunit